MRGLHAHRVSIRGPPFDRAGGYYPHMHIVINPQLLAAGCSCLPPSAHAEIPAPAASSIRSTSLSQTFLNSGLVWFGLFSARIMPIPQESSISQKFATSSTASFFKNEVLIRQLGTSQNIHCLSYCSVFKMS